jgi:hypothetical protein
LIGVGIALMFLNNGTAQVLAGLGTVAGGLGVTWHTTYATVGRLSLDLGRPLWEAQLDLAIGSRLTPMPQRNFGSASVATARLGGPVPPDEVALGSGGSSAIASDTGQGVVGAQAAAEPSDQLWSGTADVAPTAPMSTTPPTAAAAPEQPSGPPHPKRQRPHPAPRARRAPTPPSEQPPDGPTSDASPVPPATAASPGSTDSPADATTESASSDEPTA